MNRIMEAKNSWILFVIGFLALAASFVADVWELPYRVNDVTVNRDSSFTPTTTVRMSAAELYRTDGDVSMFDCYSCHEVDEVPELGFDEEGRLIWEEHKFDFDLRHGASHRNEYCYTCHAEENLEKLKTPDGSLLEITEGNALCGSCHGTNYRDWELGLHGRTSGYWNTDLGPQKREDCTSCHNAHTPAFPSLPPWPAPQPLRPVTSVSSDSSETVPTDSSETQ